jgi:hypothetical protein
LNAQDQDKASERYVIDQQIKELKQKLKEIQVREFNEEAKGQEYFIANWQAYQDEVQKINKTQEVERQIQKEIDLLEKRKNELTPFKSNLSND